MVYDLLGDIRGQFFNMTTLTDGGITAHNNPRIVEGLIGKYNWCQIVLRISVQLDRYSIFISLNQLHVFQSLWPLRWESETCFPVYYHCCFFNL